MDRDGSRQVWSGATVLIAWPNSARPWRTASTLLRSGQCCVTCEQSTRSPPTSRRCALHYRHSRRNNFTLPVRCSLSYCRHGRHAAVSQSLRCDHNRLFPPSQADVLLSANTGQPVMAHPPATHSDLSLKDFLRICAEHNERDPKNAVGWWSFVWPRPFPCATPLTARHYSCKQSSWTSRIQMLWSRAWIW